MKINVHIGRLVLDGIVVTAAQAAQIRSTVKRELARRLTQNGLSRELQGGGAVHRARPAAIEISANNHPAELGRNIARAVHAGIVAPR
jgi:hypothetical protein